MMKFNFEQPISIFWQPFGDAILTVRNELAAVNQSPRADSTQKQTNFAEAPYLTLKGA